MPGTVNQPLTELSHRERLLAAMATSIREKGFQNTTVADVVRLARTSRRTFYEHFADREACYIALVDAMVDVSVHTIADAIDPERPWGQQVEAAVAANLALASAEPELFRSHTRELGALGERGEHLHRRESDRFAELLIQLVDEARSRGVEVAPLDMDTAVMLVAGQRELMVRAAEQGRDFLTLLPVASATIRAVLESR